MNKFSKLFAISYCGSFFFFQSIFAGTVVEKFKIEGIRTIASTKALQSELVKKVDIKIFISQIQVLFIIKEKVQKKQALIMC